MSEYRGEQAEMNIQRLNVRIDQVIFGHVWPRPLLPIWLLPVGKLSFPLLLELFLIVCQIEEDLLTEKYKIKKISDDLNQTFEDMINMSVWRTHPVVTFTFDDNFTLQMVFNENNKLILIYLLRRNCLLDRMVCFHFRNVLYMSHSQILGKFEYGWGPIFKVVLEC